MSRIKQMTLAAATLAVTACASSPTSTSTTPFPQATSSTFSTTPPNPDPRIGLRAGLMDAGEATWNMRVLSRTQPSKEFLGVTNSDLAFSGPYAIQGSYNGYQVWDISNPSKPVLAKGFVCPASQSDVSVYKNLLFVSGEGMGGRLDCGTSGVKEAVSHDRLRGIRIFDITDIRNPKYVGNVQTCRGSHTHTLLEDPKDKENVYIYISGSSAVRPEAEMPGCVNEAPSKNPNSALFRIEVIKVPLANPAAAAIVNSPRIFNDLAAPPTHGDAPDDLAEIAAAKRRGEFIAVIFGETWIVPNNLSKTLVDSIAKSHGRTQASAADSAALRTSISSILSKRFGADPNETPTGPTQCHDITVYPAIGMAGGACEGYGLLLDISNPANPRRVAAVADSNFSYWHSATFNNDGTKVLFSDEWGGGGGAKCRATDPKAWGADAIFTIENKRDLKFRSYYKLPVAQTTVENCVAHNGSMIPIPGRDIMIQSWYQGGISLFEWTDASNPREIGFFDRGPVKASEMGNGGSWSVYWYNGAIVSSEISRGLDILELVPSGFISQNEIDAAKTVKLDHLNTQGQPHFVWPATLALARAYVDQLERSGGLPASEIATLRKDLGDSSGSSLTAVATRVEASAASSRDGAKVRLLAATIRDLAAKR